MRPLTALLFVMITVTSCQKESQDSEHSPIIDNEILLRYTDADGSDLFTADTSYSVDNMKVYYKIDGVYEYMYDPNHEHPKMYYVTYEDGINYIHLIPSNYYEEDESFTLLELKPNVVDTIDAVFDLEGGHQFIEQIWFNGEPTADRRLIISKD